MFEVNDIVAASELVRHDLGVCIMPASIAARFPDLAARRFVQHAPAWKVMVVRRRGDMSPAVEALLRHITPARRPRRWDERVAGGPRTCLGPASNRPPRPGAWRAGG